jgi:hypothetical protein
VSGGVGRARVGQGSGMRERRDHVGEKRERGVWGGGLMGGTRRGKAAAA